MLAWNERFSSWSEHLAVEVVETQKLQDVFVACEFLCLAEGSLLYLLESLKPISAVQ